MNSSGIGYPVNKRKGFTLIEVMVALAVSAVVLASAGRLLRSLSVLRGSLVTKAAESQRAAQELSVLERLGRHLLQPRDSVVFIGTYDQAAFRSLCDTGSGWQSECIVTVIANSDGGTPPAFRILVSAGDSLHLGRGYGMIQYLTSTRNGGEWVSQWSDSLHAPLGFQLVGQHDTTFIRVGSGLP